MSWRVEVGDALDVLRTMPDNSVDAVCTDPPAAISFMSKNWDSDRGGRESWVAWLAEILGECRRVMKPGAHAFIWALPRTSGWTHRAIEDAGFDVRDCITHHFGSGFPKSANISKMMDRAAGAEREVVARHTQSVANPDIRAGATIGAGHDGWMTNEWDITAPTTDLARQWDGWGTSLKPAAEFWYLARKPMAGTVAANVATHGTGALNIGASRIGTDAWVRKGGQGSTPYGSERTWNTSTTPDIDRSASGRWPANLILSHVSPQPVTRCHACDVISDGWHDECPECGHVPENDQDYPLVKDTLPGCVPVGVRRVKSQNPVMRNDQKATGGTFLPTSGRKAGQSLGYADPDGTEAVAAYECVEGCPVAEMDRQSGERKSSEVLAQPKIYGPDDSFFGGKDGGLDYRKSSGYGDSGTASRFFLNILPEPHIETECVRFRYVAKASRRERNCGLDGMPDHPSYMVENGSKTSGLNGERYERTTVHQNGHPCVKPVALLRWLSKLVCQPGGTILDPFMGSGSGGMAAILEGFDYIGIEMDESYADIARRRIAHVEKYGERWLDAAGKADKADKRVDGGRPDGALRSSIPRCPEHGEPQNAGDPPRRYRCGCALTFVRRGEPTPPDPHDLTTLPLFAVPNTPERGTG